MRSKLITYEGLLNDIYYQPTEIDTLEVFKLVNKASSIPQQLLPFKGIIHVIDYTKRRHVGISGSLKDMSGYVPDEVMDNGLDFVISVFQADDFKVYNESIFPKIVQTLNETSPEEQEDLIFSFNYRMKRPDGSWFHLYQQTSYVSDPVTGLPLYNVGICTDISSVKQNNTMMFSIDIKGAAKSLLRGTNLLREYYYPDPEESKLSKREREVLGWLAEGYSSKQIAGKLYISEGTVIIHRKNMLRKTNTRNIAELISYGSKHGLI